MKGLLKNNFYAVRSSAKTFSIFMLLLGAFVTVVVSQQLLLFYMAVCRDDFCRDWPGTVLALTWLSL